jgi:glycosyltransferase involved in cell wall biosynthesis
MNMMQVTREPRPLVSVVLPSYNHRRFVNNAIRSVFRQTYRPIELIIIDDGSSDGSAETIREFLNDTPPPKGISVDFSSRKNRGAPATINEGIEKASGDYVAILNSDDAYFPERIEECLAAARSRDSRLVFTYVEPIDAQDKPLDPEHRWRGWYYDAMMQELDISPSIGFVLLTRNIAVATGNLFFRRELYDEVGPFADYRYAHDLDFLMRALEVEEPALIRRPLYWYRLHDANTIGVPDEAIDAELEQIYRRYFVATLAERPRNPVAPTFANWPSSMSHAFGPMSRGLNRAIDGLIEKPKGAPRAEPNPPIAAKRSPATAGAAITLVSHDLSRTGAPKLALDVARSMVAAGAKVNLISLTDGPLREDFERIGIPVKVMQRRPLRQTASGQFLIKYARLIGRFDRRGALRAAAVRTLNVLRLLTLYPHIRERVLINSFASWPIALPIIQCRRGARISWYIHESYDPALAMREPAARQMLQKASKQPNVNFLFGSDGTRRVWASYGYDGQVRYWSGMPSDVANGKAAPHDDAQPPARRRSRMVLTVGAGTPRKGTPTLIEAFAYGRSVGLIDDDVELVIVGCPPPSWHSLTRDLLVRIHRPDLRGKVRLVGVVKPSELEHYYSEASVYVQSSTMECLPLALLDAMAHGLPIVSTDVDGCAEAIVHGACGLTVPPRDIHHLAEAIGRLLADPAAARTWGDAARSRFVSKFSLEATANALLRSLFPEGTMVLPTTDTAPVLAAADDASSGHSDSKQRVPGAS